MDVEEVKKLIVGLITGELPGVLRPFVEGHLNNALGKLAEMAQPIGYGIAFVSFHVPKEEEEPPPPDDPPPDPDDPPVPTPSGVAWLPVPPACELLTESDVTSTVGGGGIQTFRSDEGQATACNYFNTDESNPWDLVSIGVVESGPSLPGNGERIPGFGDEAIIQAQDARTAVLTVRVGDTAFTIVAADFANPVATVKDLARVALAKITP
jgi:hypothetical protein